MCEECKARITEKMRSRATAIEGRRAEIIEMFCEISLEANKLKQPKLSPAVIGVYGAPYIVGSLIAVSIASPEELEDAVRLFIDGIQDARTLACADGNLW